MYIFKLLPVCPVTGLRVDIPGVAGVQERRLGLGAARLPCHTLLHQHAESVTTPQSQDLHPPPLNTILLRYFLRFHHTTHHKGQ